MADYSQQKPTDTTMPAPPVSSLAENGPIGRLPVELQIKVMEDCTYESYNALGRTGKYFHTFTEENRERYLFHKESSRPSYPAPNSYPCYSCNQFLFYLNFADAEKRGAKAHGGVEAKKRICLLCAVQEERLRPGDMVIHSRVPQYVCRTCTRFCGVYRTHFPVPDCHPQPMPSGPWSPAMSQIISDYNVWVDRRRVVLAPTLPMPRFYLREYRQQREIERAQEITREMKSTIKKARALIKDAKIATKIANGVIRGAEAMIKGEKARVKRAKAMIKKAKSAIKAAKLRIKEAKARTSRAKAARASARA